MSRCVLGSGSSARCSVVRVLLRAACQAAPQRRLQRGLYTVCLAPHEAGTWTCSAPLGCCRGDALGAALHNKQKSTELHGLTLDAGVQSEPCSQP